MINNKTWFSLGLIPTVIGVPLLTIALLNPTELRHPLFVVIVDSVIVAIGLALWVPLGLAFIRSLTRPTTVK